MSSDIIVREFTSLLHRDPSAEQVAKWLDAFSRGRTVHDLRRDIIHSPAFRAHIEYEFRRTFDALVDGICDMSPVQQLLTECRARNSMFTAAQITTAVKSTPAFRAKYEDLAKNLYGLIHDQPVPAEVLQTLLAKAVTDPEYTIDALQADIISLGGHDSRSMDKKPVTEIARALPDQASSAKDVAAVINIMSDSKLATELFTTSRNIASNPKILAAVDSFPRYFDRDMSVHELLRLYPTILKSDDVNTMLANQRTHFSECFRSVSDVYNSYLEKPLDELSFIKEHQTVLDAGDRRGIIDTIIDKIVSSAEYASRLQEKLHQIRPDISIPDLNELVSVITGAKIPISNIAHLTEEVVSYFKSLGKFLRDVSSQYNKHLNRTLEAEETDEYSDAFRRRDTDMARVVGRIRSSIEYTNVIADQVKGMALDRGLTVSMPRIYGIVETLMQDSIDKSRDVLLARAADTLSGFSAQ